MTTDGNRQKYESDKVVSLYEARSELQPAELHLFSRHLKAGLRILDMGVGGGRTTPHLAKSARRYVGADYSSAMVDACRRRFPENDFRQCDATDMAMFSDAEFDAVVFSFNGIDVIRTDADRARCLTETARVLEPGGVFVFSSHNARQLAVWPQLTNAKPHQALFRSVRAFGKSVGVALRTIKSGAYAKGEGYLNDPVHGGMYHYVSTPQTMLPQLVRAGFTVLECVAGPSPSIPARAFTPWYYYACRKEAS